MAGNIVTERKYLEYKPLNQKEVIELAKKYQNIIRLDYLSLNVIKIQTKFDTFFCEITDKYLILKHLSKNKRKLHHHFQRRYFDYPYMFNSIHKHDMYKAEKRYINFL